MKKIDELRRKIDEIDEKLIELLNKRTELVKEVIEIKEKEKKSVFDPSREKKIIERLINKNKGI
jgi:chorismate mutase